MNKLSLKRQAKRSLFQKGVYPPEFNDEFKKYIRSRDKDRCQFPGCSTTSREQRRALDVHHIDYTKRTVTSNCISLCRECHKRVHASGKRDKALYKGIFQTIVVCKEIFRERPVF